MSDNVLILILIRLLLATQSARAVVNHPQPPDSAVHIGICFWQSALTELLGIRYVCPGDH